MKQPTGAFDGKIKLDFTTWKEAVQTHFDSYGTKFPREEDMISWLE
jgi:hypothetical protein